MAEDVRKEQARHARRFYDRISHVYDALADAAEQDARERGIELLAPAPGEALVEVGYGTGHALVEIARAVGPDGRVAGIDVSEGMYEEASRRLRGAGVDAGIDLRVAAAPPLPWEDEEFDGAFLAFTLELFPDELLDELLGELYRVLRPGGRLGVVAMARTSEGEPESLLSRSYRWVHRHFPHIVDCRPIDSSGRLRRAGFTVAREERVEIWTIPVAVVAARRPHRAA